MEKRDFYELAEANVKHFLPDEYQDAVFKLMEMEKMNEGKKVGLVVGLPGRSTVPLVYLDDYYEEYMKSRDATGEVERLAGLIQSVAFTDVGEDIDKFMKEDVREYEQVKRRLEVRICDAEDNAGFLAAHPHTMAGDFAATYAVRISEQASMPVTNENLELYGVSAERLHADAMEAESGRGFLLARMDECIEKVLLGEPMRNLFEDEVADPDQEPPSLGMYVLTNKQNALGASAILHGDVLKRAGEILGGDYIVLPSSMDEVVLLSGGESGFKGVTSEELTEMVRAINEMAVKPAERLSDKVQYYDFRNERLVNYKEYERMAKHLEPDEEKQPGPMSLTERQGAWNASKTNGMEGFVAYPVPKEFAEMGGKLPEDVQRYAYYMSRQGGVDYSVVLAIIEVESGYRPDMVKGTGDTGYMQLIGQWHEERMERLGCENLADPYGNIKVGIDFLAEKLEKHEGNYGKALMEFRYGELGARKHFFSKGKTTCKYVEDVMGVAERIEKELEKTRWAAAREGMSEERTKNTLNGKSRHVPVPRL